MAETCTIGMVTVDGDHIDAADLLPVTGFILRGLASRGPTETYVIEETYRLEYLIELAGSSTSELPWLTSSP